MDCIGLLLPHRVVLGEFNPELVRKILFEVVLHNSNYVKEFNFAINFIIHLLRVLLLVIFVRWPLCQHPMHFLEYLVLPFTFFFCYEFFYLFFISRHHLTVFLCQTINLFFLLLNEIYIFLLSFCWLCKQLLQIILKHAGFYFLFAFI